MRPTEELRKEHGIIMRLFAVLQSIGEMIDRHDAGMDAHLEQIMEFLTVFVDRCHHRKEEEIFFPELVRSKIPDEGEMVGVLVSEHLAGREIMEGMRRALDRRKQQVDEASPEFADVSNRYVKLFRQHIRRENGILFPMANERLSADRQEQISKGFQKLENEKIGQGRHEAFHGLIEKLEEVYRPRNRQISS
jgi:hemerythrin-like domain-containing protein